MCSEISAFAAASNSTSAGALSQRKRRDSNSPYSFAELDTVGGYIGQKWAVGAIQELIENRLQGFDRKKAPLVLLFTGPSGVGKTELAHHIAAMVHGTTPQAMRSENSECFVQLPMNQYQEKGSINNLIGPPVGIMGEGQLTGALKACPSAVVLLDEFEKAHPAGENFMILLSTSTRTIITLCFVW